MNKFIKKLWLKPLMMIVYLMSPSYNQYRTFKEVWEEVKEAQGL